MKKSQNKIEKLIKELCPNGVEYGELGDLVDYEQPSKYIVKDSEYSDEYKTPVLTAGQTFILGYTNEDENIFKADEKSPVIIFDDFTTSLHWVDFAFKVKSSAMKILLPKNKEADFRYIYYAMKCINFVPQTHARHWISKYSKFRIPLPPLDIQKEIAKILNEFTELEAELEAELESRKKQYEYYRDRLLVFENGVERKFLEECADINRGVRVVKTQLDDTKNYPVYQNSLTPLGYYDRSNYNANTTFIISAGAAGDVGYSYEDFWAADDCLCLECYDLVLSRYLYHYLLSQQYYLYSRVRKASIPRLSRRVVEKLQIPIPPLSEQKRIVSILDKFDSLVNDISIGLPAELKARRKQYEYYRNKLLTFKEYGK